MSKENFTRRGRMHVAAVITPATPPSANPAAGLPADYISAASLWQETFERYWLIERLIERGRVYELFGRYKGGKTLVAIDMVCHLAAAKEQWAGRRTAGAFVVWIAGEAVDDVKQRIAAWLRHHDIRQEIPLYIRVRPAYMDKAEFARRVASEVSQIQRRHPDLFPLLVIDTVARNLSPGCDENSIQGLGAFINNLLDLVVRPHNAAAICIHHPGHGDPDRGRGHSSFPGAVDGIIKVTMEKTNGASVITVSTSEARNTAAGDTFSFRVKVQELPGEDNFSNPIDAPVLRYLEDYQSVVAPTGKHEKTAYSILKEQGPMLVGDWHKAFQDSLRKSEPNIAYNTLKVAWRRTHHALIEKALVIECDSIVSLNQGTQEEGVQDEKA